MYFNTNLLCKLRVIYVIYTIVNLLELTEFENENVRTLGYIPENSILKFSLKQVLTLYRRNADCSI